MTRFNAIGHELTMGNKAISFMRKDVLRIKSARRDYRCNDCQQDVIKCGDMHGSPEFPPFSRHVCVDCLRNAEVWDYEHQN